jgi:DNA-binding transcriptional LysR family regulator
MADCGARSCGGRRRLAGGERSGRRAVDADVSSIGSRLLHHSLATAASVDPADVPPETWMSTTQNETDPTFREAAGPRLRSQSPTRGQGLHTALSLVAHGLAVALLPQLGPSASPAESRRPTHETD